jgi:hypothetical protein
MGVDYTLSARPAKLLSGATNFGIFDRLDLGTNKNTASLSAHGV